MWSPLFGPFGQKPDSASDKKSSGGLFSEYLNPHTTAMLLMFGEEEESYHSGFGHKKADDDDDDIW